MAQGALTRRTVLRAAAASMALVAAPALAQTQPHIVIVGGGYGGASCARALRRIAPDFRVTLIEPSPTYTACPLGNAVIAGLREFSAQQFSYDGLKADGIAVIQQAARDIDAQARTVTLTDGTVLHYERLVLSPGIDLNYEAIAGYSEAVAEKAPHAWKTGAQVALLRRQIEAMDDGGLVAIAAPDNPSRCPLAVYERASLIAHYLKTKKPRSKLIVLDAKDTIPQQRLFLEAWKTLYPGVLEWVPLSDGGKVNAIDPKTLELTTDFGDYKPAVVNIIPAQIAGAIAARAGVTDRTRWCPVVPATFESTLQKNIHVIGDAALLSGVAKAAFAAQAQADICAAAMVALIKGETPVTPKLVNACYSLVAPDFGLSVVGVYDIVNGDYVEVEGAGGGSPPNASAEHRAREAKAAQIWFDISARDAFG